MILVSIKKRFPNIYRVSKSKNRMNTTLETFSRFITWVSFGKRVLGMKTPHQVFLTLRDLEKNLTSSVLVLSDKLVFVLQFLLVPVCTVAKPASNVTVPLRGPSRVASQCFLPSRKLSVSTIGCGTTV